MSICLSHTSADLVLRKLSEKRIELEPVALSHLEGFDACIDGLPADLLEVCTSDGGPIELLVDHSVHNDRESGCHLHQWVGELPQGSLYRVSDGVYVVTPALYLLQRTSDLHFVQLCQHLGYYLGSQSHEGVRDGAIVSIADPPLLTVDGLWAYLQSGGFARGTGIIKEALRWTCEGAASPQETNLQLALSLPAAYHGFQLAKPYLNYEVELSAAAKRLYPHRACRIDLCWEVARTQRDRRAGRFKLKGLEYQGGYHQFQLGQDLSRHYALLKDDVELLYVAKEQLTSAAQMFVIAEQVARWTGKRPNFCKWPNEGELQWLLNVLSGALIPKPGVRFVARQNKPKRKGINPAA